MDRTSCAVPLSDVTKTDVITKTSLPSEIVFASPSRHFVESGCATPVVEHDERARSGLPSPLHPPRAACEETCWNPTAFIFSDRLDRSQLVPWRTWTVRRQLAKLILPSTQACRPECHNAIRVIHRLQCTAPAVLWYSNANTNTTVKIATCSC